MSVIVVITETKLDDSIPTLQFLMKGFVEPFRLDRNRNRCGVMIYIQDDIPRKLLLKHNFQSDIEGLLSIHRAQLGNVNGYSWLLNFMKCKLLKF